MLFQIFAYLQKFSNMFIGKKTINKWACVIQTHVAQGSTVH